MAKGKGWHRESRRHSLASRGVKTAVPKSQAMMKVRTEKPTRERVKKVGDRVILTGNTAKAMNFYEGIIKDIGKTDEGKRIYYVRREGNPFATPFLGSNVKLKEQTPIGITKEGFLIVKGKTPDKVNEFYRINGVYAYESYIPYTNTSSTLVYFVSGSNGDEFGQYTTKLKALDKAREMSKLTQEQRKKYDE